MREISAIVALAMLSACGGGGSPTPSVVAAVVIDPNLTIPFQTFTSNLVNNGISANFTISGWVNNSTTANPAPNTPFSGSGSLTLGTPTSSTFDGIPALKAVEVITGSLIANGQPSSISSTGTLYYRPSDYTTAGVVAGGITMFIDSYTIPVSVKAGATGSFGIGTQRGFFAKTTTEDFVVSGDSATTLLVTFVQKTYSVGNLASQAKTVYRINTSGNFSLVTIEAQSISLGSVYKSITYTF